MYKNRRPFWYALYTGSRPVLDNDGHDTGEVEIIYGNPVKAWLNMSTTTGLTNNNISGKTENEHFGINMQYNCTVNPAPLNFPMDEHSICWIDTVPEINVDGSTDTPYDHYVHRVVHSLNSKAYLLTRVGVSNGIPHVDV